MSAHQKSRSHGCNLFAAAHRTVTGDVPSHGLSQPAGAPSRDILADAPKRIGEDVEPGPAVLVGPSMSRSEQS